MWPPETRRERKGKAGLIGGAEAGDEGEVEVGEEDVMLLLLLLLFSRAWTRRGVRACACM